MMDEVKAIQVLRAVEWRGAYQLCPSCYRPEMRGHRDDCKLAALLADAGDLPTIDLTPENTSEALTIAQTTGQAALMVADLLNLFGRLGVPEGCRVYVRDPLYPDQRFVIRRLGRTQGKAGEDDGGQ